MLPIFKIKRFWFAVVAGVIGFFGLIAFTEHRQQARRCQGIRIEMDKVDGHRFLNRTDVLRTLTNDGADPLVGDLFEDINLKQLERRLRQNGLVQEGQVYRDLRGNLVVDIRQPLPLARLVHNGGEERSAGGLYLSREGRWFPLSMNYTARVMLLSGPYFREHRSLANERGKPLIDMLNQIAADPFWRAFVAQIIVDENGEVTLVPQAGDLFIEIGQPVDLEPKFEKIKLFYKHILPMKGWNRYSRVSVQYRNQIVCE